MKFKEIAKKLASKGLPLIATALGGPMAGNAVEMVTDALGLDSSTDEKEIIKAIEKDPDALLKLKALETEKELELRRMDIQEDKMYVDDTKDARKAQIEREKATGSKDINLYILAWVNVTGFLSVIMLLIFGKIDANVNDILYMLLGVLAANFTKVNNYFFGSSKGSKDKTQMLKK